LKLTEQIFNENRLTLEKYTTNVFTHSQIIRIKTMQNAV